MERLHPNVRIVWLAGAAIVAGIVLAAGYAFDRFVVAVGVSLVATVAVVVAVLGIAHAVLRYRAWRFEVQDDALWLHRGVLTKVDTSVPFVRVQHVDTQRGPISRLVGLSSVVVYTAGSRGADVSIPGLRPDRATALRERLRDLAIESEHEDAV